MNNLVRIENGRPVTDSLTVAETFGKEHRRVMQDIRELDCSDEFRVHHFVQTPYEHPQNQQIYKKYLITEQGFAFLVMGYTGKEAARFKEMYIMEFNRMRDMLHKPTNPQQLIAIALIEAQKLLESKDEQIAIMAPKAAFFDDVAGSKDAIEMGKAAKVLNIRGYGRNNLFEFLRDNEILMSDNTPYQTYIDRGYFRTIEQKYTKSDGSIGINIKTLVYQKGLAFIRNLIKKQGGKAG